MLCVRDIFSKHHDLFKPCSVSMGKKQKNVTLVVYKKEYLITTVR